MCEALVLAIMPVLMPSFRTSIPVVQSTTHSVCIFEIPKPPTGAEFKKRVKSLLIKSGQRGAEAIEGLLMVI